MRTSTSSLPIKCHGDEAEGHPNPSLHLTFAGRLRRLAPAGDLSR